MSVNNEKEIFSENGYLLENFPREFQNETPDGEIELIVKEGEVYEK